MSKGRLVVVRVAAAVRMGTIEGVAATAAAAAGIDLRRRNAAMRCCRRMFSMVIVQTGKLLLCAYTVATRLAQLLIIDCATDVCSAVGECTHRENLEFEWNNLRTLLCYRENIELRGKLRLPRRAAHGWDLIILFGFIKENEYRIRVSHHNGSNTCLWFVEIFWKTCN